jgi:hypothetical protein
LQPAKEKSKVSTVHRHTLAADKGDEAQAPADAAEKLAMEKAWKADAESYSASTKAYSAAQAWEAEEEDNILEVSKKKEITKNVASHKYGSAGYEPTVAPKPEVVLAPVFNAGSVGSSTYISTSNALVAAPDHSAKNKSVLGQYGAAYEPKVVARPEIATPPAKMNMTPSGSIQEFGPLPEVPSSKFNEKLKERVQSTYGVDYKPKTPVVEQPQSEEASFDGVMGALSVDGADISPSKGKEELTEL